MKTIKTFYRPPTSTRGGVIKAWYTYEFTAVAYDHSISGEANHIAAAKALATQLGLAGKWYGAMVDGAYIWVLASEPASFEV